MTTTWHLLALLLCVAGFMALALAMERHQEDVFETAPSLIATRGLRTAGWALLLLALAVLVRAQGWALGLVAFAGHTSGAAGAVFVVLICLQRWRAGRPSAGRVR